MRDYLLEVKRGKYSLEEARKVAKKALEHLTIMADEFCADKEDMEQKWIRSLLEDVQTNIMKIAIKEELAE